MNLNYAQYALNVHEIAPSTPLQTFSFLSSTFPSGLIDSIRITISPSNTANVRIVIGFYDNTNFRSLYWATGADTTAISVNYALRSTGTNLLYYGVINGSTSTIYLLAHYLYVYLS